jgi:hypothetical protein
MKPKQMITTAGGGICLAAALSLTLVAAGTIFAQGPLTPPGAPAPTMKTLVQVEPRTPVSSLPFSITEPGSYYLTTSLTGNADASQPMTNGQYSVTGGFWLLPCAGQTLAAVADDGFVRSGAGHHLLDTGHSGLCVAGESQSRHHQLGELAFGHAQSGHRAGDWSRQVPSPVQTVRC